MELFDKLKIVGWTKDGLPLYTWKKEPLQLVIPGECDFITAFYPKDPFGAREYFK